MAKLRITETFLTPNLQFLLTVKPVCLDNYRLFSWWQINVSNYLEVFFFSQRILKLQLYKAVNISLVSGRKIRH